jgi:NADPH-dependent F420 reductase
METIALLGGTGPEGQGLALRFALAGHPVRIGSRDPQRAEQAATTLNHRLRAAGSSAAISGGLNRSAAEGADIICPVVPHRALPALLAELGAALDGRVLLDVTVPISRGADGFGLDSLPSGSTGEWIQQLAPRASVVSGFKNLSANELLAIDHPLDGDVLLCGDDAAARDRCLALANRLPNLRGIDAGPLRNSRFLEAITALLLNLNRRHRATTSIRILGL